MPPDSSSSREPIPALSWEGDRMFNIYIYDYCFKRGFRRTARELMIEADLVGDATPPINARQGLLFEWWSVFWVLFQAKSGNSNHEDALLYIHHQNAQKRMHPTPAQQQQPGVPIPLGNQPPQSSNPQSQPQAPIRGMPNGMPLQRQPPPYHANHANGAMSNGINPAMGGQPAQPGQMAQQPMQGQPGGALNYGGIGGQPNGVVATQQPPSQGGSQQHGPQAMSFNPMMSGTAPQRPSMNGQPQQPGQQQPRGPYTSPPMARSPQGGAGQPTIQGPQPGPQAPMAQLGPSPQLTPMSRSMLPPNAGPMPMNLPTSQQGAPPNATFNPGQGHPQGPQGQGPNTAAARPPSRSRPTPSPSMSARQPPGPQQQAGMGIMMQMGPMQGMPAMGTMNLSGMGGIGGNLNPDTINHELMLIPNMTLTNLRHELGLGDKDSGALNMGEKMHLVNLWKQRSGGATQPRKDGVSVPGMLPPGQPQMQQMQQRSQHPQPSGSNIRLKRNSTSPSEENEPRNESSPPERKRIKRSPAEPPAVPPGYPQHIQPSQPNSQPPAPTPQQTPMPQPGPPGGGNPMTPQQQAHIMMMRHQMTMGGPSGQPGQGKPGVTHPTGAQSVGMPMHPNQMHPPQQPGLFRGGPPGPAAARPSGAPQFHPTPLTQLATKPHNGMLASSPAMNGPSKEGAKDITPPQSNGQSQPGNQPGPDVSPRNTTTAPPTPGASSQPTPGLAPTSLPPPASASGGPSAQMPTPQQSAGMPGMLSMNMTGDFMFETTLMEDFDVFGKQETDINFERDFGQWFNTTEDGTGLEMK